MIRVCLPEDQPQMMALWERVAGVGVNERDDSEEGIRLFLQRNPGCSFVAEEDGCIVGTILCGHDGRRATVYHLAVDSAYRNRRIATGLVSHVMQALHALGIGKVKAIVFADNELGAAFWTSSGWTLRSDIDYYDFSVR